MQIVCPKCKIERTIQPKELLGKVYICPTCHGLFVWDTVKRRLKKTPHPPDTNSRNED